MNKRILISACFYTPAIEAGGPVISIQNLISSLYKVYDFYIIARNHDLNDKNQFKNIVDGWNNLDRCNVYYLNDNQTNLNFYKELIDEIQPSLIYLNSIFDYKFVIPLLKLSKRKKIKTLIAPRGQLNRELLKYNIKKIIYLIVYYHLFKSKYVFYQSTCAEEDSILSLLFKKNERIVRLDNIPTVRNTKDTYKEKIKDTIKIIFLSRICRKKNLYKAVEFLKNINPKYNVIFEIYGPIEDLEYWNSVKELISSINKANIVINYNGLLENNLVHQKFLEYDLFLFPTLSENFGHVIAESLNAGCPVLISNQTPWLFSNNESWAFSLSDEALFTSKIECLAKMDKYEYNLLRECTKKYFVSVIDTDSIIQKYKNYLDKIL